jgi:hypothetical protein
MMIWKIWTDLAPASFLGLTLVVEYVFITVSISPSPDLCKDVVACVGEAGRHMLLVGRVKRCFGEAIKALE